jgi:hypothetical protein
MPSVLRCEVRYRATSPLRHRKPSGERSVGVCDEPRTTTRGFRPLMAPNAFRIGPQIADNLGFGSARRWDQRTFSRRALPYLSPPELARVNSLGKPRQIKALSGKLAFHADVSWHALPGRGRATARVSLCCFYHRSFRYEDRFLLGPRVAYGIVALTGEPYGFMYRILCDLMQQ